MNGMSGEDAYILGMDYVDETLKGAGALKGQDGKDGVSPVISVNTSTSDTYKLDITDKNGTITTPNLVGKQGLRGEVGETGADGETPTITENADNTEEVYKLDFTTKNGTFTTKNIIGKQGLEGVSPSVTTNPDNTAEDYRLNITTKGGTFTTPNLRGPQGEIGPQGESAASAINPRGDYDVNADPHYTISDYITSAEGNTYVCKKDNPGNVAPTDGTVNDEFWQVLALRGARGEEGKDGEKGADGVTFTPSIDENGVLSFTNNGGLANPEPIDIRGDNGVTFTPSIDADGYLSFTNDGNLENPEPIKVLGKDGVDGKDGIDGTTYIPSIGTVTTVESNADASAGVTVDEETKEAVFNFAIPKGNKGLDGVQISDNETVENKTWSSQKTSSKIAEVETELNAKVDKTDIATTIDLSSTDEQVASAKAVYDGLENINDFSVQVVKENLDLNDITETGIYYFSQAYTPVNIPMGVNGWLLVMKGSSSDIVKQVWYRLGTTNSNSYNTFERYKGNNTWSEWTKFLTEKEYYNALDYGNPIIPQDADLNDYLTPGVYTCMSSTIANTLLNCPHIGSNFKLIVNKNRGNDDALFYGYQMIVGTKGGNPVTDVCVYYRGISVYNNVCVFSKWKIMSGSTVADVPETTVDLTGTDIRGSIKYMVKSGICYVSAWGVLSDTVKAAHILVKADVMPKPIISCGTVLVHGDSGLNGKLVGQLYIDYNKALSLHIYPDSVGDMGFGSFSYPVAES